MFGLDILCRFQVIANMREGAVAYLRTGHSGHALPLWIWGAHAGNVKER